MALQGFDKEYYLGQKLAALQAAETEWSTKTVDDLEATLNNVYGLTAEEHYQQYGWQEGLAPNQYFNAEEYKLAKGQQLFDSGNYLSVEAAIQAFEDAWPEDPYQHYIRHGAGESINPSNAFDASQYFTDKLADLQAEDPDTYADWTAEDVQNAFLDAGLTAIEHYLSHGVNEGLTVTPVPADEQVDPGDTTPTTGETFTLTEAFAADELPASYTLTDASIDLDTLTVAAANEQLAELQTIIDGADNADELTLDASYTLEDSLENFMAAEEGVVDDADSYTIADGIGPLSTGTFAEMQIIANATEVNVLDEATVQQIADFNTNYDNLGTYSLADTTASLLDAASSDIVAGAEGITVSGALTVDQYSAFDAEFARDFTYSLADTLDNLAAAPEGVVDGADDYSLADAPDAFTDLSVADALSDVELSIGEGALNSDDYVYTLSDTLENFMGAAEGVVDDADSYTIDAAAVYNAGEQTVADVNADYTEAADLIAGAENSADLTLAGLFTYSLADTFENLVAAEDSLVDDAAAYSLTDPAGTDLGELSGDEYAVADGATNTEDFTFTVEPADVLSITPASSTVVEGEAITLDVALSHAVNVDRVLDYKLEGVETAAAAKADPLTDLGQITGKVTVAAGETTATITLTPAVDVTEGLEAFSVKVLDENFAVAQSTDPITIQDAPNSGQTFTLTTDPDDFTGGAGNDTFKGTLDDTTGAVATTLTALDSLDGGDGQDIFNLNVLNGSGPAGTAVTALPTGVTVANIETLKLASAVGLTANTSTWTDVENVNVTQVAGDLDLTVDSASAVDVAGVTGLTEITNGSSVNVSQKIGDGANIANAKDITVDVTNSAAAADANADTTLGDGVLITGATGVVDVNVTGQKLSGDDGATATDSVSVTGGTSVNVTQVAASSFGDAATKNAGGNDVVTQGAVDVTATANTSEVTITQDASRGAVDAVEAVTGVASTQEITFSAMTAGQVVSLDFSGGNTLSFTAKKDLTASEVASVFANLENGDVQVDASASLGLYTDAGAGATADNGKWSSGDVIAVDSTKSKVVFSNADNTVTAIADNASTGGIDTVAGLTAGTNAKEAVEGVTGIANGQVLVDDHTTTDAIETITLDGYGAASRIGTTNDTTALSTLNLSNSGLTITANTGAVTAAADLTVDDTAAALDLNLEAVGHKSADAVLAFTAAPTTLNVTSTGANYVDLTGTGNQIETLAVDGTGVLDLGAASVGTGLKTVTVSGEAGLTLEGSESANITSVNTSATTGKVTSTIDGTNATYTGGAGVDNLTLATGTALTKAIDLGAGDDTLSFAALAVTGSTATLSGGDGTDTLSMAVGTADSLDGSTQSFYTNFERLVLNDAAVGTLNDGTEQTVTIDLANLGFTDYVTTNGTAADTTAPANADVLLLKNMASNGTVVLDAAAAGTNTKQTVEIKDAGTATDDVLNVVTDAATGTDLGTLTADNVETLNITANDTDTSVTAGVPNVSTNTLALDADKATNLTLDGDGNLTLTMTAATSEVATIDASLMTGKLNVTTNAGDSGATTVTGGSAADTLTAQGANDVLIGGAGNDSLIVSGGVASAVTLTGGDGTDSFDVSGFTAANGGSAVTITGFEVGETIEFAAGTGGINFATGKVTLIEEATFSEYVQEAAAQADAAAEAISAGSDAGIAWFEFNSNTFIVQDVTGDGAFTDGSDVIVKLNGVVDLSDSSFSATDNTLEYVSA